MSLSLPDPLVDQGPWEGERTGVQRNFDRLAQQFPLGTAALQDDAVTQAKIADDAVGTDQIAVLPQARVYNTGATTVVTATDKVITFDSERFDLGTSTEQHSTALNTGRLTCRVAGLYVITGSAEWSNNTTGERALYIRLNGTTALQSTRTPAGTQIQQTVTTQYRLAVADYVELLAFQTSGADRTVVAAGNYSPEFMWHWASP